MQAAWSTPRQDAAPGDAAKARRPPPSDGWLGAIRAVVVAALMIGGAAAAGTAIIAGRADATGPSEARPLPIAAIIAEASDSYTVTRYYAGQVEARRASRIGFERGGLITRVLADDGDRVVRGQVVAELDIALLETGRQEIVAQRAEARARLNLARLTLDRQRELNERGHIPDQRLDESRFEVQVIEAQVQRLEASLARIDVDLAKSRLLAPFDSIISDRLVDEGTVVTAGMPVFAVLDSGPLEARIGVPVRFAEDLAEGAPKRLEIAGKTVSATVEKIVPSLDPATRTVTAILSIEEALTAASGQLARLAIEEDIGEPGFWLPTTALTEGLRGLWTVFVLEPDGDGTFVVTRGEVEILHTTGDRVFVRGTLEAGDRLVASGLHRVAPGQRVTLEEAASLATAAGAG